MAAWQAWLLLAAAAALAAALFLVKLRPPRLLIPSLLLWRRVLDEAREQTLWERIRRAVSLAITVLIALALALAATRPGRTAAGAAPASGRLLVVLDASWSMQARTRGGETRWQRAVGEARRLFAAASGTEVALATTADGLVEGPTTDAALIESALDRVDPGGGDAAVWPALSNAGAVHFITDGATPRPLPSGTVVHSVFEPAPNVGITALEVRPSLVPEHAGDAYLEIGNFAAAAQKVRVRISRGETPALDRQFDMAASEVLRQVLPIPRGGDPSLTVRVEAPENALDVDDEAFAWADRARPLIVTIVGSQTQWLRTAFERDADVRATFLEPALYRAPAANEPRPDAYIFDRWAPAEPPRSPALFFSPPAATAWLAADPRSTAPAGAGRAGPDERQPRWEVPGTHQVVQGVDPFTLTVDRAHTYGSASLTPVARSVKGTPLVLVDDSAEARVVVVAFSMNESNLTAAPAFPVLLGNALEWLTRPSLFEAPAGSGEHAAEAGRRPGLIAFEGSVTSVTGPRDTAIELTRVGQTAFGRLRRPGIYLVQAPRARRRFALNIADPQLSNLTRTSPLASGGRAHLVTAGGSAWPWWLYCALAALALAVAEWWTWQRRITV